MCSWFCSQIRQRSEHDQTRWRTSFHNSLKFLFIATKTSTCCSPSTLTWGVFLFHKGTLPVWLFSFMLDTCLLVMSQYFLKCSRCLQLTSHHWATCWNSADCTWTRFMTGAWSLLNIHMLYVSCAWKQLHQHSWEMCAVKAETDTLAPTPQCC